VFSGLGTLPPNRHFLDLERDDMIPNTGHFNYLEVEREEKLVRSVGGIIAAGEEATNFSVEENPGHGNCLHYSLAPSVSGATYSTLRPSISGYISTHLDDRISDEHTFRSAIAMLNGTRQTPEEYCAWQGKAGEFSGILEIAAFCRDHKKYVLVYRKSPDGKYLLWWTMGNSSDPTVPIHYDKQSEHYEQMVEQNDAEWTQVRERKNPPKPEYNDKKSARRAKPGRGPLSFDALQWDDDESDEEQDNDESDGEQDDDESERTLKTVPIDEQINTPYVTTAPLPLPCSFKGGMQRSPQSGLKLHQARSVLLPCELAVYLKNAARDARGVSGDEAIKVAIEVCNETSSILSAELSHKKDESTQPSPSVRNPQKRTHASRIELSEEPIQLDRCITCHASIPPDKRFVVSSKCIMKFHDVSGLPEVSCCSVKCRRHVQNCTSASNETQRRVVLQRKLGVWVTSILGSEFRTNTQVQLVRNYSSHFRIDDQPGIIKRVSYDVNNCSAIFEVKSVISQESFTVFSFNFFIATIFHFLFAVTLGWYTWNTPPTAVR